MDTQTLISNVIAQTGTDASRATILSILNERYREQVADSHWLAADQPPAWARTAPGIITYLQGDNLGFVSGIEYVEITDVAVGSWSSPYARISAPEMRDLIGGQTSLSSANGGGVWAVFEYYDPTVTPIALKPQIALQPTPTTTLNLIVYGAAVPVALTDDPTSVPITPTDFHGALIDGTGATILRRIDERPDLSQSYEQAFQASVSKLLVRRNQYARGRGPVQIQVPGYHWSG